MANIRLSVVDQETGDNIPGRVLLTPRPMPGAGLWLDGEDIVAPTTREHPVLALPSYMNDVEVPPAGWYYHLEFIETEYTEWGDPIEIGPDKPGGWRFKTDFLLLEDGSFYLEDLPTVDPCDPDSGVRPDPVWWRALRAVQDSMDSAVQDAEDAATRAEAAAIGGSGFSQDYSYRVFSVGPGGGPELVHGDPDAIMSHSVASITKLMTCLIASRWHEEEGIGLGHVFTVDQWDIDRAVSPGSRFQAGDEVRLEDLMYAALLPSDNIAPVTIARGLGYYMLQADGDPTGGHSDQYDRFVHEMNRVAADMGFARRTGNHLPGAYFTRPGGGGRLSPRMMADLILDCSESETLGPIVGADEREISIGGPSAREITVRSYMSTSGIDFPEKIATKGGTQAGRNHQVTVWEDPDGGRHVTVVADVRSGTNGGRFAVTRRAMDYILEGRGSWEAGGNIAAGDIETAWPWVDITDQFPTAVKEVDSPLAGIFIMRSNYDVHFRIQQVYFEGVSGGDTLGSIPEGLAPFMPHYDMGYRPGFTTFYGLLVPINGDVRLTGPIDEDTIVRLSTSWPAYENFPQVPFPGTPHERL